MDLVGGVTLKHIVLSDQTDGTFGEKHLVAELDRCAHFAAFDEVCMWLEDRKDFLCRGHLFTVEHTATRLINHPIAETDIPICFENNRAVHSSEASQAPALHFANGRAIL